MVTLYCLTTNDNDFNEFGKRESKEMRLALGALFFARLNELVTQGYGLSRGESIPKIRSRSTAFTFYTKGFLWLMLFVVIACIYFFKTQSNDFEN
jgi:hypothetical protein